MIELVPIKIKVTKDARGMFIYPKFKKTLQFFKDNPDYQAFPLLYDKKSDCKIETDGSPLGMRWCMKLVPKKFAEEALLVYPDTVFEMTEEEAEEFYNNKAMAHMPENKYDIQILQGLQIELDLREKIGEPTSGLRVKIKAAIDPDNDEPGIKKNKDRKWLELKKNMNLKIIKTKEF